MQILLKTQQPTFKQIQLSEAEFEKAKNRFKLLKSDIENPRHNYEMFDIFEKHMNNEIELKQCKTGHERRYFSKSLYLKFFRILGNAKREDLKYEFENFIKDLNNYCSTFNSVQKAKKQDDSFLANYNVTSAKQDAHYFFNYLGMTKEEFLGANQKMPFFHKVTRNIVKSDIQKVSEGLGLTEKECIELYRHNIEALCRPSNWILDNAIVNMEVLGIEKPEEYKMMLKLNPQMLTLENLEDYIKTLSDFLETDESNVKLMIVRNPLLVNTKFEHIKSNFYAMKDYIKVDRTKMQKIAIIAPKTIGVTFEENKTNYNDMAKILGMLPQAFIRKANKIPFTYQLTPTKLEGYIELISKEFNYTRNEAIDYINKNFNILGYGFSYLSYNIEDNYKILNKEYGINSAQYKDILKENSWLFGEKKEIMSFKLKEYKNKIGNLNVQGQEKVKEFLAFAKEYVKDTITNQTSKTLIKSIKV